MAVAVQPALLTLVLVILVPFATLPLLITTVALVAVYGRGALRPFARRTPGVTTTRTQ